MSAYSGWNKSQQAEVVFWENFTSIRDHFSEKYWQKELDNCQGHIRFKDFEGKSILEVGCGPKGMIHYVPGAKKVGVDPLIEEYRRLHISEDGNVKHITGVGECLGFEDGSFDIVVCFNVLDHSEIPQKVIKE